MEKCCPSENFIFFCSNFKNVKMAEILQLKFAKNDENIEENWILYQFYIW